MNKIRKGDEVVITTGRDKGRRGTVIKILEGKVVVENVNMVKRHTKPNPQRNVKGGIVERESPLHVSNVALLDPKSDKPTRVGIKILANGTHVRVAKRSGLQLDK